ncbi:sugar ABC transporter substrate-binding protein [Streptomyces verrucosisporus]|uniref:ABC transporter substrate-binding protein n=1 Tax=Streptomyces verrucosisporus TaxID=1695161 RepID=UPI0019D1D06E|nr:sugar ABC transporter substrate-binding protein [Streptomyces verrucosisporus]MBN3931752.1 sugar ABC transporter substrate-binding protein [Streptomyces verrucosisporus]
MNTQLRRAAVAVAATAMAVSLAACGSAKEAGGGASDGDDKKKDGPLTIGLLLPEDQTARYENFDKPLIEKRIKELCSDCEISYVNAKEDASTQQQQMNSMITKKVDAIILDAVDAKSIAGSVNKADQAGIPVVAYDRLAEGPISAYTSFDNEQVGKVQGTALLEKLGDKAEDGQIVMMNGSPTDPNAAMFKKGAKSVLDGKVKVGKSYDTTGWKPEEANKNMSGAIASLGKENIVGVYSANDGMAGGIITALKSAGVDPLPPVTGQDAELAGVQRIISGDQFMTVYKPFQPEAYAAAEMAVALARGEKPETETTVDSATTKDVPATLIEPIAVTVDNLKDTVVEDGLYTVEEICTAKYAEACEKAGLK